MQSVTSCLLTSLPGLGSVKNGLALLIFFFILSMPLTAAESSREFLPTRTCCQQLSCSPPCPADPLQPHRQVAPETQHGNSAFLLNLRSFNALLFCSGSGYNLLFTNGRKKEEMPTWESGQWTFQRGSAFGVGANS